MKRSEDRGGGATKYVGAPLQPSHAARNLFIPETRTGGIHFSRRQRRRSSWALKRSGLPPLFLASGFETDQDSAPPEVGWIGGVHLAKGCYPRSGNRRPESIILVDHRDVVLLRLDSSIEGCRRGAQVLAGDRVVGIATPARHWPSWANRDRQSSERTAPHRGAAAVCGAAGPKADSLKAPVSKMWSSQAEQWRRRVDKRVRPRGLR